MERKGKRILQEAVQVIDARGDHYGSPLENWTRIADFWTVYLKGKLKDGESITPLDHGLMMDLVSGILGCILLIQHCVTDLL